MEEPEIIEISSDDEDMSETQTFYWQVRVDAASATPPPRTKVFQEARSILKRKAEDEKAQLGKPKNVRYGAWVPTKPTDDSEDAEMTDATDTQPTGDEAIWPEQSATKSTKAQGKKTTQKKPQAKPTSDSKRHRAKPAASITAPTPTDSALEVENLFLSVLREGQISLSLENLITLSLSFAKFLCQLTTRHHNGKPAIDSPAKYTARVTSLGTAEAEQRLYVANTPKAIVRLNGEFCKALIDTGAEINVMTEEIREIFDLPILVGPALRLISHSGHKREFLGVCEDVDVTIGGVVSCQNIFVVDSADHVLVLGTPFLIKSRASMDWDTAGNLTMTCQSTDATRTAVTKVLKKDRQGTGLTEDDLFPNPIPNPEDLN